MAKNKMSLAEKKAAALNAKTDHINKPEQQKTKMVRLSEDIHYQAKIKASTKRMTLQGYIEQLIKNDSD